MDLLEWERLSDSERSSRCQHLNPYEEWTLFKEVESLFVKRFGDQEGVGEVFCGIGGSLGPINAISVEIVAGKPRTKLPKDFLGFPVLRTYKRLGRK